MMKTGTFNRNINIQRVDIGPYERYRLQPGIDTIALTSCDAPAVQIVADGTPLRLNAGACLPVNGHAVYMRNPYSRTIRAEFVYGLEPSLAIDQGGDAIQHSRLHGVAGQRRYGGPGAGLQWGVMMMGRRSRYRVDAWLLAVNNVAILPKAKLSYLDHKPALALADDDASRIQCYDLHGAPMSDIVSISGTYSQSHMDAWRSAASWERDLVPAIADDAKVSVEFGPDTAVIFYGDETEALEVNARIFELGDWDETEV